MNKKSRSSVEMSDPKSRPAIAEKLDNMGEYDVVYVGFPIWWYVAPTIINTFLESYDFSGKTIALFATSGGSGLGKSADVLKPCCSSDTKWAGGIMINRTSDEDIKKWCDSIK